MGLVLTGCGGGAAARRGRPSPVGRLRLLEAEHDAPEIRQAQPVGHGPAQHPALLEHPRGRGPALAGDHQDEAVARGLGAQQEGDEPVVGLRLAQPVQVDHPVHVLPAPAERLALPALQGGQRGRGGEGGGAGR
jgi:hypothetical protein